MIIPHTPDSTHTDTGTLPDAQADLLEAAETFRNLCVKYKRQFFLALNATDDTSGRCYTFWNFLSEHMTPRTEDDTVSTEKRILTPEEMGAFYNGLNMSIMGMSSGMFFLVKNPLVGMRPSEGEKGPNDKQGTP